jgi:hypothetical protein
MFLQDRFGLSQVGDKDGDLKCAAIHEGNRLWPVPPFLRDDPIRQYSSQKQTIISEAIVIDARHDMPQQRSGRPGSIP